MSLTGFPLPLLFSRLMSVFITRSQGKACGGMRGPSPHAKHKPQTVGATFTYQGWWGRRLSAVSTLPVLTAEPGPQG